MNDDLKSMQILVVDDEPEIAAVVRRLVHQKRYTVLNARSLREARALISVRSFSLIILESPPRRSRTGHCSERPRRYPRRGRGDPVRRTGRNREVPADGTAQVGHRIVDLGELSSRCRLRRDSPYRRQLRRYRTYANRDSPHRPV